MLKFAAHFAVLATGTLIGAPHVAAAASNARHAVSAAVNQPVVQLVRSERPRSRSLKFSTTQSGGPCGVWRCTWPTSDGGCLVWEKTKCKVINPFD